MSNQALNQGFLYSGSYWPSSLAVAGALVGALITMAACGDGDGSGSPGSSSSSSSSGGGGAGGGSAAACIEPSVFADAFAIAQASDLCAVAMYEAALDPATFSVPTWGSHGGPLTILQGSAVGSVKVSRWQVPAEPMGTLMEQTQELNANLPADAYLGAQALDLPFFGWTALSWTPPFPSVGGELVLLSGNKVEKSYKANSPYAIAALGDAAQGRLLYSGLSLLDDANGMSNGLYAADSCGSTAAQDARLLPLGDGSCGAPLSISAWGEASGPIAVDSAGNVFTVMSKYSTADQELRGFEASLVTRGKASNNGQTIAKLPGYGSALAALAPAENGEGLLLFQPAEAATGPKNVMGFYYQASPAMGVVLGQSENDILVPATPATALGLMTDSQNRVWVAVPEGQKTRFIVLSRSTAP